jgi:acetyl esterase
MTVDEIRSGYIARCLAAAGPLAPMAGIDDVETPAPARLYTPREDAQPMLVYLHGGRFISGGSPTHDARCRLLAEASGWRVLLVDYRRAPEHRSPAALDDARAALQWARRRSSILAVGGDSAGGNLAAAAALQDGSLLSGVLLFYPMLDATCHLPSHEEFRTGPGPSSDDMRLGYELYLPPGADRRDGSISPILAADLTGFPPAFVFTVETDSLRDEGRSFADRLRDVRHVHYPGLIHGILTLPAQYEEARRAIAEAAAWLKDIQARRAG